VLDIKKDEEITYILVMTEETDASRGMISTGSPIGRSLVGKEAGDVVKVQLPGGMKELEILKVKTIHELAG
jgi:transcription elongation factor GreA